MMQIKLIVSYAILYTCIGIILYGILLATLYKQLLTIVILKPYLNNFFKSLEFILHACTDKQHLMCMLALMDSATGIYN